MFLSLIFPNRQSIYGKFCEVSFRPCSCDCYLIFFLCWLEPFFVILLSVYYKYYLLIYLLLSLVP